MANGDPTPKSSTRSHTCNRRTDCAECALRPQCTTGKGPRVLAANGTNDNYRDPEGFGVLLLAE